jgi:hypothetical protein
MHDVSPDLVVYRRTVIGVLGLVQHERRCLVGKEVRARRRWTCEIGFPMSASRFWERSRRPASGMPASVCRSVDALQPAEKSGSPACSPPARSPRRGACSSPSGVRLARGPKVGPWRGPLPRRWVTPPPILGDFLDKAMTPSGRSAASSPGVASPTLSTSSSSLEVPALIDGAVVEASDAMKAVSPANRARDDCDDRGHAEEAKNLYGLGHLAHRFQSLWA